MNASSGSLEIHSFNGEYNNKIIYCLSAKKIGRKERKKKKKTKHEQKMIK